MAFKLNLQPVKASKAPSQQEESDALFATVEVTFLLRYRNSKAERTATMACSMGESIMMIAERIATQHGYVLGSLTLFLGELESQEAVLLDPLSLNDFPQLQAQVQSKRPLIMLVMGDALED